MYNNSIVLAITGVILIIVGLAVQALLPVLAGVGGFTIGVGWVLIAVAVIVLIIEVLRGVR